jgi:hypothetical protein
MRPDTYQSLILRDATRFSCCFHLIELLMQLVTGELDVLCHNLATVAPRLLSLRIIYFIVDSRLAFIQLNNLAISQQTLKAFL